MNTPGALETIRKIREEFGDSILVGAGTVLTYTEAQQAIDAGAAFYFLQLYLIRKYWICAEKEVLYQFREHSHHRKYGKHSGWSRYRKRYSRQDDWEAGSFQISRRLLADCL